MKFYNPFKPHIVETVGGQYLVRKFGGNFCWDYGVKLSVIPGVPNTYRWSTNQKYYSLEEARYILEHFKEIDERLQNEKKNNKIKGIIR